MYLFLGWHSRAGECNPPTDQCQHSSLCSAQSLDFIAKIGRELYLILELRHLIKVWSDRSILSANQNLQ